MAKVLQCGKNKIAEPEPVHGFGMGPTKAKSVAMDMAHGSQMESLPPAQ